VCVEIVLVTAPLNNRGTHAMRYPYLLSVSDVAALTGRTPATVRRWARGSGILGVRAVRVGGQWCWPADEVAAVLRGGMR